MRKPSFTTAWYGEFSNPANNVTTDRTKGFVTRRRPRPSQEKAEPFGTMQRDRG
ncbi:MAG: hypothetical protein M3Q27_08850 [Actinomycetota bacterium]|nr:hypothetical protein [Actinomycetota bacterium]